MFITRNFFELVIRLPDLKLFMSGSYFFALMQKSKQKKSSQKNLPAAQAGASRFFGGPSRAMIFVLDFNHTGLVSDFIKKIFNKIY